MSAGAAQVAGEILAGLIRVAPDFVELLTGVDRKTLEERIARARAAIEDPIDTSADDAVRRAELERIVRGDG